MMTSSPAAEPAAPLNQVQQYIGLSLPPDLNVLLPNTCVTEVIPIESEQIVSLPEMAPCVMGLTNWRGEVLWVVDVSVVMGKEPLYRRVQQGGRQGRFDSLVVQYQQQTVGLVVDQVTQLRQLTPQEIRPLSLERRVPSIPGLQGAWVSPEGDRHWILDTAATVQYIAQALSGSEAAD
ncbi:CheW domain-containing protein [filamentous cyanobacterium LEGE 11480]|uniref:CheW domain-containing protein n=1 Tax=Romeriopsis navalis LEGE 11480 TaxID=2777977 RepID=A0A928VL03_9CYAN|nr:chemotaxis protein CheW [Romeriopsis navalis]MBE9030538.1 CheW domain-containing protein [Romeriopsis navalis LEGE 11480]